MREYRAKRRSEHEHYDAMKPLIGQIKTEASERIRALEAEVARLKRELAARPAESTFNSRPFTPVPKHKG
jgi:uncharacterized small protein (DUF1192 family)